MGKDEAEITVALGKGHHRASGWDADLDPVDPVDTEGALAPRHPDQSPARPDRQHHDARRPNLPAQCAQPDTQSVGDDDLFHFHGDRYKWSLRFTVINLTNKEALYNFLSTFSGTHYVTPRTFTAELGFHF